MEENYLFQDKSPYPPVKVCGENSEYAAAMLSNIGECGSEMSAISMYLYNSIVTKDTFSETAECFKKISIVEMHHLNTFATLAYMLGTDPRLWHCGEGKMVYWTPDCIKYPNQILLLLENALCGELDAIAKYKKQMEWIRDENIVAVLKRTILDEELHVRIFKDLYKKISGKDCFINRK